MRIHNVSTMEVESALADPTTLADPAVVARLRHRYSEEE